MSAYGVSEIPPPPRRKKSLNSTLLRGREWEGWGLSEKTSKRFFFQKTGFCQNLYLDFVKYNFERVLLVIGYSVSYWIHIAIIYLFLFFSVIEMPFLKNNQKECRIWGVVLLVSSGSFLNLKWMRSWETISYINHNNSCSNNNKITLHCKCIWKFALLL